MRFSALFILFFSAVPGFAQKAQLVVQSGHFENISAMAWSPNGKFVASGAGDHSLVVYDASTALQMSACRTLRGAVEQIEFTKDSRKVAALSRDFNHFFVVYDFIANDTLYTHKFEDGDKFVLSPNNKLVAVLNYDSEDKGFNVIDFATGKEIIHIHTNEYPSRTFLFTQDSKQIVFLTRNGTNFCVVDVATGAMVKVFPNTDPEPKRFEDWLNPAYITKDNSTLVCGVKEDVWFEINLSTGAMTKTSTVKNESYSTHSDFHFTSDKKKLVVSYGSEIRIFDAKTGAHLKRYGELTFWSEASALAPDDNMLAVGSGKDVVFFNLRSGKVIRSFKGVEVTPIYASFSNNGKTIAINDYHLPYKIWNLQSADAVRTLDDQVLDQGRGPGKQKFSPDDKVLFTGGDRPELVFLPTLEHKQYDQHFFIKYRIITNKDDQSGFDLNPDFSRIIIGGQQFDYTSGSHICDFDSPIRANNMSYTYDGKYTFAYNGSGESDSMAVSINDASNCKRMVTYRVANRQAQYNNSNVILVSRDNKYLVAIGWDITVVDFLTGKEIKRWPLESWQGVVGLWDNASIDLADINADGTQVAISSRAFNSIGIFSLEKGKFTNYLDGLNDKALSVRYGPDGKSIVTTSGDRTVRIWDPNTGRETVSFVSFGVSDYVVSTPDNYYMCSKNGLRAVAFRVGNKMYKAEQFDLRQNRPDTVLQRMTTATNFTIKMYKQAWKKRLKKAGYTEAMLGTDYDIPQIKITNLDELPVSTAAGTVTVNFTASDSLYTLDRYNVYVNDVPLFGRNGKSLRGKNLKNITEQVAVDLSKGVNKITVAAFNEKGTESVRETAEVFCEKPSPKKHALYIVAVGVSNYKDVERNLKFAAKDAGDFVNALKTDTTRFAEVYSTLLINETATKDKILALKSFLSQAKTDDQVILYFSGHGLLDEQMNYFLATHDVNFSSPSVNGLPYDMFESLIDSITCRNKLVLIDACHSGEVDKEETVVAANSTARDVTSGTRSGTITVKPKVGLKNSFALMQQLFTDIQKGTGATIISAAGGMEYALESKDWNNGVFTYSLMEGLSNGRADYNKDMVIRVSELKQFVSDKVYELTKGAQTPTARKENTENDFIIR